MTLRFLFYLGLLVVVFLLGLVSWSAMKPAFKFVVAILCLTILSEATGRLLIYRFGISNDPVYHIYLPILYCLHGLTYLLLMPEKQSRLLVSLSIIVFIIACIVNSLFFQRPEVFPSNALLVCCVLLITCALFLFRKMLNEPVEENIFIQPVFWYNLAVLFFYSSTFLLWSFLNYFIRHKLDTGILINLIYAASIIYYSLIGTSFLFMRRKNISARRGNHDAV